jgi:asparagine synthase (glutamine-hydrolysing)
MSSQSYKKPMCGIAGILDLSASSPGGELCALAARMATALRHRGPDGDGVWADAAAGIALGHRRLAIIDLSPAGSQPMASADGRYVISYNGEIYNAPALRSVLEQLGHQFRGRSDTEVIVEGCAAWGVRSLIERLNGMFAFALWDRVERSLILVRDRLGIKPLYWGRFGDSVLFGSELRSLERHPAFQAEIDRAAVVDLLGFGYVKAPRSIYARVHKLRPAHILTIRATGIVSDERYWDLLAARGNVPVDEREALAGMEALLHDAVRQQLLADVPLGAFLSGGIDSSTVVALMTASTTERVRTFTIGFHETGYDEAAAAKAVARHLGTQHTELYLDWGKARDLIPDLPSVFDEPFADSSQIPMMLLARMTREHIKVALSGDGGDEAFAGYTRYRWALRLAERPHNPSLAFAAHLLQVLTRSRSLVQALAALAQTAGRNVSPDQVYRLAELTRAQTVDGVHDALLRLWSEPAAAVIEGGRSDPGAASEEEASAAKIGDPLARMQFRDIASYLPEDILCKVDRATMAFGLEARVPLLDHRVVEAAWRLPRPAKLRNGTGKWLLRQILFKHVPRELLDRPKQGFGVPIGLWLRGPLREWAEELLSETRLQQDGYLRPQPVRRLWREHLEGHRNRQYQLWPALMFLAWRRRTLRNTS